MIQLIAFIFFLGSVAGIAFLLYRKIPALVKLPQNGHYEFKKHKIIVSIENTIKHHHFHLFKKQMLLHRILSFIKVWTLRIETYIDHLLHGIRKKAQELDKKKKNKK